MELPEELIVTIIAMIPFPQIFKARVLSKSWQARFSPITFQAGDSDEGKNLQKQGQENQRMASIFQNQVEQWCSKWKTFCPVSLDTADSWGYDSAALSWRRIPSLSFLPEEVVTSFDKIMGGGLLFLYQSHHPSKLYVANILTRSWKMLPPRPEPCLHYIVHAHIVTERNSGQKTYKIIMLCVAATANGDRVVQMYDSKSNAWSSKKLMGRVPIGRPRPLVYLDGVLYRPAGSCQVLGLDVESDTVGARAVWRQADGRGRPGIELITWKEGLLLIVTERGTDYLSPGIIGYQVVKVDVGVWKFTEIARSPPLDSHPDTRDATPPFQNGDFIYFGLKAAGGEVLTYNLEKNEWSYFHFPPSPSLSFTECWLKISPTFRPGLNPFLAV